jgi:hypothetical protein
MTERRLSHNGGHPAKAARGIFLKSYLSRPFRDGRLFGTAAVLLLCAALGWAKWEKEQVALENDLTQRIEGILSKTLAPNSYLVTVKVEMEETGGGGVQRNVNRRGGENPFLQKNKFVLPGVPEKKQFNTTPEVTEESTVVNQAAQALVKKISISVMVAPDVTREQINSLREFISSAIPFNPLRGDELDIKSSPLLKSSKPTVITPDTPPVKETPWVDKLLDRTTIPLLLVLGVVGIGLVGLTIFLFGPVRAFFNSLVAVLPRVGEQAAYAAGNNAPAPAAATAAGLPGFPGSSNGHPDGNGDQGPKLNMPFAFIREEQLPKLPLLFREMSSTEVALILAYLPPAWASKLLTSFDPATQAAVTRELSRGREVPPDVVAQVEAQIREKLPYMVGGVEWIQSVFPLTPPAAQRVLLNTLSQESPELAKNLRQKTFFFEDLAGLTGAALRALVQDLGYPVMALAVKDEKKDLQDLVLNRLPPGIRAIVQQEVELAGVDKKAIADAKNRLVLSVRRLLIEGRISLGGAA